MNRTVKIGQTRWFPSQQVRRFRRWAQDVDDRVPWVRVCDVEQGVLAVLVLIAIAGAVKKAVGL